MGLPKKEWWLDLAEVADALRLWPRIMLSLVAIFLWDVHSWYTAIAEVGIGSDVYANLVWTGVGVILIKYMETGRRWPL